MASIAVQNFLRGRFANVKECAKSLGVVEHNALRGRFREILAQDLLAPFIPPTIEMVSGTIVAADNTSRQVRNEDDIVLFDTSKAPLLFRTTGRDSIIPSSGVVAHIEVKSKLTFEGLKGAVSAAKEINELSMKHAPLGLIFAYSSDIGTQHHLPDLLLAELKTLKYAPSSGQTTCPIQGVCIIGRGAWFLTGFDGTPGWYSVEAKDDRELLAFISIISNSTYASGLGLGTHVLDTSWLVGPNPATEREVS